MPLVTAVFVEVEPASAKLAAILQFVLASVLVRHRTVVVSAAPLSVIDLIAKGPALGADFCPLIVSSRPHRQADRASPSSRKEILMTSRRTFLIATFSSAALAAIAARTASAQAAKLEESDRAAVALGYRHDAAKVDAAKYPTFAPGRNCANCQLFQGKSGEAWGACGAVGGKLVNAKGWCVSWVKKA